MSFEDKIRIWFKGQSDNIDAVLEIKETYCLDKQKVRNNVIELYKNGLISGTARDVLFKKLGL